MIVKMKKKVLLMGKSGSGKTSMRSMIFADYNAKDTQRLGPTIDVEHSHVRFLGNLVLNLWDCGGQEAFMENYFLNQRENIFKNVEVLIYVFDVESRDDELIKDFNNYETCLSAIYEYSPTAKVFCLIHKMDLVNEDQREKIFLERENKLINMSKPIKCVCFKSSIWDETLYGAWSSIVNKLVPNIQDLEQRLKTFAELLECDEVLLFERATFLIISYSERVKRHDRKRFEKVSNIIKRFKFSCSKLTAKFTFMEVRNSQFAVFMDVFTPNTFIMVVTSDLNTSSVLVSLNIKNARKHFEMLEHLSEVDLRTKTSKTS